MMELQKVSRCPIPPNLVHSPTRSIVPRPGLANFPEQSAQPLLPEDVDPLPPIMPEWLDGMGHGLQLS